VVAKTFLQNLQCNIHGSYIKSYIAIALQPHLNRNLITMGPHVFYVRIMAVSAEKFPHSYSFYNVIPIPKAASGVNKHKLAILNHYSVINFIPA
jgi:hypothetical protein